LDPRPLEEGPRPKSGKSRQKLHGTFFGGKINWFRPTKTKEHQGKLMIWRTKMQASLVQGLVQLKDSICSKFPQTPISSEVSIPSQNQF